MMMFPLYWYWYPYVHFISLALTPTAVVGLNANLKVIEQKRSKLHPVTCAISKIIESGQVLLSPHANRSPFPDANGLQIL